LPLSGSAHADQDDGAGEKTEIGPASARKVSTAAIPRDVRAWFDVASGPAKGPIHLTMVRTEIGRGRQADVRIDDRKLSRKHATVTFTGQEFRIRDEDSGNGTLLNGSRVVEYALHDGDEVVVGGSALCFRMQRVPK
jgi:RNase P/RNase MRP subunit p29